MVFNSLVNKQYGKWNAVLAKNEKKTLIFGVDGFNIFPETLDEWIDVIRSIKFPEDFTPLRMDIDITNYCNNDCVMCFSNDLRHIRKGYIKYSALIHIFKEFRESGGKSIRLTGGGDCLVHPSFIKIIDYLDQLNLKISIQTNGDKLFQVPLQRIIAEKAHSLRVSVDSSSNKTRILVHKAKNKLFTYDRLINNIDSVISSAKKNGRGDELLVGATFVVLPENYRGVRKFIKDMYSIGVRWLAIRNDIYRDLYKENPSILPYVQNQIEEFSDYPNLTIVGQYKVSYDPPKEIKKCWVSYIRPIVLADSSLHLCCMARNKMIPRAEIGYLSNERPFEQLFKESRQKLSEFHNSVPYGCKVCIDFASNIFIAKVKCLIDKYDELRFFKAFVKSSTLSSSSFDLENQIFKIGLSQNQYERFQEGFFVDL